MEDNGVADWQSQKSRMTSTARSTTEAYFRVPVAGATETPYAEDAIPPQTDAISQKFKHTRFAHEDKRLYHASSADPIF